MTTGDVTTETISLAQYGSDGEGYLARPGSGSGPGVLVIQEWWGLDWGIKEMANRLAAAGFVALAPDLYRGELAAHDEMDKAAHLMTSLPPDRAAQDMNAAVDALLRTSGVQGNGIGVVGFCMGGLLSFLIGANRSDAVRALVPFYGFPSGDQEPDFTNFSAIVRGHMAEHDDFFGPAAAKALEQKLQALGKDVTLTVHAGTGHAFMAPHNALGTLNEEVARAVWPEVTAFLHATLAAST